MMIKIHDARNHSDMIKGILNDLKKFLPRWAIEINVQIVEMEEGGKCSHLREYGMLRILLSSDTLSDCTHGELRNILLHEICHCYNEPIFRVFTDVLPEYIDEAYMPMVKHMLKRAIEEQTTDLEVMLRGSDDTDS